MVPLYPAVLDAAAESAEYDRLYTSSKHAIELLSRDEDNRQLRTDVLLLEDDVDELHDQLQHEQECSDRMRSMVDEHLERAQAAEASLEALERQTSIQKHDIARLQAEVDSLRSTTQDATTVLSEKLALARELSILKPEVAHLRAQSASIEQLVGEKLALQRQVADAQCEVESARAEAKRAQAKRRNTTMEIAQEAQVEDLKKQLAREKRARVHAEEIADQAHGQMNIDDLRREVAREKKLREALEEELEAIKGNTQIEDVRRELLKTKKAKQKLEDQNETLQDQLEKEQKAKALATQRAESDTRVGDVAKGLREELACKKAEQVKLESSMARKEEQWELDKTSLDDKLNQFRAKLRETKELLKTTKEELEAATERALKAEHEIQVASMRDAVIKVTPKKATTKRAAKLIDPSADETSLGTPGDGPQAKRSRKASAAIGSKSSFSITPFLNKTTDVDADDDAHDSDEAEQSPTKMQSPNKLPLARASSIKGNTKLSKPSAADERGKALTPVAEEEATCLVQPSEPRSPENGQSGVLSKQNDTPATAKRKAASKSKDKPRKSLVDFETFQKGDAEPVVKQKKRKLGGRGPTLFDEEESAEQAGASKSGLAGRSSFRTTPGNRLASNKKNGLAAMTSRSGLLNASDGSGFQFSPLRRNKKNLDDTLRG